MKKRFKNWLAGKLKALRVELIFWEMQLTGEWEDQLKKREEERKMREDDKFWRKVTQPQK